MGNRVIGYFDSAYQSIAKRYPRWESSFTAESISEQAVKRGAENNQ
jgi:hypothetical protein